MGKTEYEDISPEVRTTINSAKFDYGTYNFMQMQIVSMNGYKHSWWKRSIDVATIPWMLFMYVITGKGTTKTWRMKPCQMK